MYKDKRKKIYQSVPLNERTVTFTGLIILILIKLFLKSSEKSVK